MAKTRVIIVFSLLFVIALMSSFTVVNGFGTMVGEKMKIKSVNINKEVQELGKFAVHEYNRNQRRSKSNRGTKLVFSQVLEAQTQVVSRIMYELKIETTQNGLPKTYDAVVMKKPWDPSSKKLISFTPYYKISV